jgi:hypothetical protein
VAIQMSSGIQWQQVATGGIQMSSGARCLLVAVRLHFGLRLGGRNNPDRASNLESSVEESRVVSFYRLGTPRSRSRGGFTPPPERPPVFVIVSDIRDDSEIQDRKRVLYSYSYLRGSYGIEADLTTQCNCATLVVMLRDVGSYAARRW